MAAHARAAIRHLAQEAERPAAERFFVGESLAEFKQVSVDQAVACLPFCQALSWVRLSKVERP